MRVAAVDIGTNSMRLLITDGTGEVGRWERVTGLGRGVDRDGRLAEDAIARTLEALAEYGALMEANDVFRRKAIATSASRDAANREDFFDRAEAALGVRPVLISGHQEARFAYTGATGWYRGPGPVLVSDIGGGSTEFVTAEGAVSIDIGSVRLTERALPDRPATPGQVTAAAEHVRSLFAPVEVGSVGTLIGVAGTWTEIPSIARGLPAATDTHGMTVTRHDIASAVESLSALTIDEAAALGTFNPQRAPTMLGGLIVAGVVMERVGATEALVSRRDTLDGVATELLGVA